MTKTTLGRSAIIRSIVFVNCSIHRVNLNSWSAQTGQPKGSMTVFSSFTSFTHLRRGIFSLLLLLSCSVRLVWFWSTHQAYNIDGMSCHCLVPRNVKNALHHASDDWPVGRVERSLLSPEHFMVTVRELCSASMRGADEIDWILDTNDNQCMQIVQQLVCRRNMNFLLFTDFVSAFVYRIIWAHGAAIEFWMKKESGSRWNVNDLSLNDRSSEQSEDKKKLFFTN